MKYQIGVVLMVLLIGCYGIPTANYTITLQTVERSIDAKKEYGQYKIAKKQEGGLWRYIIEDEMVKIFCDQPIVSSRWPPEASADVDFGFRLLNKMNHSIKVASEKAAFVDKEEAQRYRVTPSFAHRLATLVEGRVEYADVEPSPAVAPHSVVGFWFRPESYVFPDSGKNIQSLTKPYVGKTYQILLPVRIENIVYRYIFTFRIDNVVVRRME